MWGRAPGQGGCLGRGQDDVGAGKSPAISENRQHQVRGSRVPVRLVLWVGVGVGPPPFMGHPRRPISPTPSERGQAGPVSGGQAS